MQANNKFNHQVLNYNVIVKEVESKNETESGIDISSVTDKSEKYKTGVVLAIGNLITSEIPDAKISVNCQVLFDGYKASDITIDGVTYKNILYADLLLIL